jgi:hemerythrin-like metal-binding protein
MSYIKWDGSLSVGLKEIDDQHKHLIGLINDLYDAMSEGKGNDVLDTLLQKLIDYTKYHFAVEEKYFILYNYSDKEAHIKEHNGLTEQVINHYDSFKKGTIGISIDIMQFLESWLINHIKKSDTKYAPFLKNKGIV